jgi:DNA-binding winged helix-turn-helix (wHTH) protein
MSDPVSTPGVGSDRPAPPAPPEVVRFGVFELDVRTRELRKRGVKVSLPSQPFQVLRLLLERQGDVVTRDELRQWLWSTDTFVNFDLSLNSAVRKLREALGDSAEQPTFIETLPRQGYRFIAPMDRPRAVEVLPPGKASRHQARRLLWALALLLAASGGFTVWIARGAGVDRTPLAPASPRQAVDPVASDLYLKGIEAAGRANVEGFRLAISYFDQAITKQPDYAKAHGGLALTWAQFVFGGPLAPNEVLPKAEEAAQKALALDPTIEEAHRALSITRRVYGDREGAAAGLSPSSPEWLILHHRFQEAVIAAQRNHDADPLSVNGLVVLATALRIAGQGTRAVATLQKALDIEPSRANVLFQLGATYVVTGDTKAAIAALQQAVARSTQRNPRYLAYLGYTYALDGRARESRQILHELLALRERQYVSSFGIAFLHDVLGEKSAALEALDRAFREHALEFTQLDIYPSFKTLKAEPRYQEIMRLRARY